MTTPSRTVDIREFGAIADGVTDDTDALLAAVDHARQTAVHVYVPGTVRITPTVHAQSHRQRRRRSKDR